MPEQIERTVPLRSSLLRRADPEAFPMRRRGRRAAQNRPQQPAPTVESTYADAQSAPAPLVAPIVAPAQVIEVHPLTFGDLTRINLELAMAGTTPDAPLGVVVTDGVLTMVANKEALA